MNITSCCEQNSNKIVIGIKHDSARETGETLQVFFITDSDKAWNGDKCFSFIGSRPK